MQSIEQCHLFPLTLKESYPLTHYFKVTPIFDVAYVINATRIVDTVDN